MSFFTGSSRPDVPSMAMLLFYGGLNWEIARCNNPPKWRVNAATMQAVGFVVMFKVGETAFDILSEMIKHKA